MTPPRIPEVLLLLKRGHRPTSRAYEKKAEGHYLSDRQRNVTRITYRALQVIIYGGITYLLIRILNG